MSASASRSSFDSGSASNVGRARASGGGASAGASGSWIMELGAFRSGGEVACGEGGDTAPEGCQVSGFAAHRVLLRIAEPFDGVECGLVGRRASTGARDRVAVAECRLDRLAEALDRDVLADVERSAGLIAAGAAAPLADRRGERAQAVAAGRERRGAGRSRE